jgi:hypothetical protein
MYLHSIELLSQLNNFSVSGSMEFQKPVVQIVSHRHSMQHKTLSFKQVVFVTAIRASKTVALSHIWNSF